MDSADAMPFDTTLDAQNWRVARREAALMEREQQIVRRERELASRDAARQRAEEALDAERTLTDEQRKRLEALEARIAELESGLTEATASSERAREEADILRGTLEHVLRREAVSTPTPTSSATPDSGRRDPRVASAASASSVSSSWRWMPRRDGDPSEHFSA